MNAQVCSKSTPPLSSPPAVIDSWAQLTAASPPPKSNTLKNKKSCQQVCFAGEQIVLQCHSEFVGGWSDLELKLMIIFYY